jgi:hypothetical protein
LWIDEAHTLHDAMSSSAASLRYPLGYWLTRLAVGLTGRADEATLRLAPALFGALALPLAVWAFAPFLGRPRAWLAAILLGASAWHLYWSQSARAYTLALFFSLAGGGYLLRGLLQGRRRGLFLGYALGLAAVFAHPSSALVVGGWVLSSLASWRLGVELSVPPPRRPALLALTLAALLVGVWAWLVFVDYQDAKGSADWLASWRHLALSAGFYVTPWVGAGAALGGLRALRRRRPFELFTALLLFAILAAAFGMAVFVRVSAQYLYVALPWFAALAVAPLGEIKNRALGALYVAALCLPTLVDLGLYFGPRSGDRPRWREAYAHVFEQRRPHDLVFGMAAVVGQYYLDPSRLELREHRDLERLNRYTSYEPGRWSRRGRRTWFVVRREELLDWPSADRAAFETLLLEECRRTLVLPVRFTPRDLTVEVYVREPWAAGGGRAP